MPIAASNIVSTAAQPAMTYPYWWIQTFNVDGSDPTNVACFVVLRQYGLDADQNVVFSSTLTSFRLQNVLTNPDPNIQSVVSTLLTAVQAFGSANKLL